MINKTRLTAFTILILGLTYAISVAGLEIIITPSKSTYLLRETVLIQYQIKNKGSDTARFWSDEITTNFIVLDSKDRRYKSRVEGYFAYPPPPFKPGESIEHTVDLDAYGPLPIGKYRVYLEIEYGAEKISKSNTIEFEIVEPSGKEKLAYDELMVADSLYRLKNFEATCQKWVDISRKYPESVYAPSILSRALTIYKFTDADKSKLVDLSREFIDKFPNSHFMNDPLNMLLDYYQSKKDKNGFREELNTLIKKYPGSKVSQLAEQRLKIIDGYKF